MGNWCLSFGDEDKEIELTLFILVNFEERDYDAQSIFSRDESFSFQDNYSHGRDSYYSQAESSTHLKILSKVVGSTRCPLKASLVGIVQEVGLTSHIRPKEAVVFVVGQLEFIDDRIYVYAQDINWIDR
ncbi:24069_t:CDS:2 [Gigaspora rosea]|nr:24069_t:CDS:2 [Gigaspora rosea]